jgi:hypothetical protein
MRMLGLGVRGWMFFGEEVGVVCGWCIFGYIVLIGKIIRIWKKG